MRRLRFCAAVVAFTGCSLMTGFDPEGQPCDKAEPNPYQQCLSDAGYFCVNGLCKKATGPSSDAGFVDAGQPDGGNTQG